MQNGAVAEDHGMQQTNSKANGKSKVRTRYKNMLLLSLEGEHISTAHWPIKSARTSMHTLEGRRGHPTEWLHSKRKKPHETAMGPTDAAESANTSSIMANDIWFMKTGILLLHTTSNLKRAIIRQLSQFMGKTLFPCASDLIHSNMEMFSIRSSPKIKHSPSHIILESCGIQGHRTVEHILPTALYY